MCEREVKYKQFLNFMVFIHVTPWLNANYSTQFFNSVIFLFCLCPMNIKNKFAETSWENKIMTY